MKRLIVFFGTVVLSIASYAQGTIEFRANLTGTQAVPANSSSKIGTGLFYLGPGNELVGLAGAVNFIPISMQLFRSDSSTSLGTQIYNLPEGQFIPPWDDGDFYQDYDFTRRMITQAEVDDLMSGKWWVVANTAEFPNGELRGQLMVVPEPSSGLLILSGGTCAWLFYRRRK
jgi:hypothetical protein